MTKAELKRIKEAVAHINNLIADAPLLDHVIDALDDQLTAYIDALDVGSKQALHAENNLKVVWSNPAKTKSRKRKARLTLVG